jgi:hypothetical protein
MSHEDIKKDTVKRTLGQKLTIFRTSVRKEVSEDLRYKSYVMKSGGTDVRALTGKEQDAGLAQEEPPWSCWRRRSGLPANLTTAFRTILCLASLSYRSMQSLTTKLGT